MHRDLKTLGWLSMFAGVLLGTALLAQEPVLPAYASLLPQQKAQATPIDPQKGYLVKQLKPDVYMMTDGHYEAMFVVTGKGVVLFDAPPSMAKYISQAIAEITSEPLIDLVYSHVHVDHIGGASLILQQHPGLAIIAEEGTLGFLQGQRDPHRPLPTRTFKQHESLRAGSMTAELRVGHWHSPAGDLFIYLPDKKVLMAVDALSAGSVPFMGLDLTQNMDEYRKVFDQVLGYDFDIMVPGHHGAPAYPADVLLVKEYVMDLLSTVPAVLAADHSALIRAAVAKYGKENSYAAGRVLIDQEVGECAQQIKRRWANRLDDVDVWAASHCTTVLVYQQWDVGPR